MGNHAFFQNRDCEFFPCHEGVGLEDFSCLFCFCPLYPLGRRCGGACTFTRQGVKSCAGCAFPHRRENYCEVLRRSRAVLEMAAETGGEREDTE